MTRKQYYVMSFTWGLPCTILGLLVATVLIVFGHRPKRFGWAWCFEVGRHQDGFSLGFIFFCGKYASNVTKAHEYGHSFQNCKYGLLMPILTLCSVARYIWFCLLELCGKPLPDYDSWWFEGQATKIGINNILR